MCLFKQKLKRVIHFLRRRWFERFMRNQQLFMYLIVGVFNTLFGYFVYACLIWIGLTYLFAVILSTCCGVFFNFNTFGRLVFKQSSTSIFMRFVLIYAILCLINIGMIAFFNTIFNSQYYSGLVAILVTASLSFFLNKKIVFCHQEDK